MSCDLIYLVQGDSNRPQVQATITDENTGAVVIITGSTPIMKFRMVGSSTLQATITGIVTDGPNGVCVFAMPSSALSGDPGNYEGEIQITFSNGDIQTVYDTLKFRVREDF
jgi:energy-coupling factor transporter ATP-binding protein EcfA2